MSQVSVLPAAPKQEAKMDTSEKEKDVRTSNIIAARSLADAVRTSLGPKGMDKMIVSPTNDVIITNDGATILKQLEVIHPCAKMLVDLAHAQDVEAGDGTTTVTVIAGSLLAAVQKLLSKGIHPTQIAESFLKAASKSEEILQSMAIPVDFTDRQSLLNSCNTALNSKVVSQYSSILSPIAVDAVLHVVDAKTAVNADLRDIRVSKKLGGTIEDTEMVNGLVFTQHAAHNAGGPTRVENAKIGLIQFCLSAPKTNMEGNIQINDYTQMDRILREEKIYIANLCKAIQKTGCNVLLIQKSILRDAVNELSLAFLAKMKIMVVKDIERDEIEFVSKTLGCQPAASIETFTAEKLGSAKLVEELSTGSDGKIVKITGVAPTVKTVSILVRGSNKLVLDEAERSIHDALCVMRCLTKTRFLIAGGAAPEIELSLQLSRWAKTLSGVESYCINAYADALETVPYTLAENAGLHPIQVVTELRTRHDKGERTTGISVRKGTVANMVDENVIQPLLVSTSMIRLATETVAMILKIDDIVAAR